MKRSAVFLVFCAAVMLVQAPAATANADGLIGKGKIGVLVGTGKLGGLAGKGMTATLVGKADFPPAPTDWAAGQCTG